MKPGNENPKIRLYLFLLAIQIVGVITFVCREVPGATLIASLFALFCAGLEVERLGQAFEGHRN